MIVILDENECSIGRAPTNQLRLGGDLVSRRHCVIRKVGNQSVIEDLSANGTFVNNEPVKKCALAHFDHLTIGDSDFIFLLDESEISQPTSLVWLSDANTTTGAGRRLEDVLYLNHAKVEAALPLSDSLASDLNELLRISRAINAVRQPSALAQRLLDSIFEIVPAERGVLLRFADEAEELTEEAVKSRQPATEGPIQVKRLPIQQARYERRPMLFTDVAPHQWLLVVPLIADGKALGVIYLSADDKRGGFDDHHIDMVTAIADLSANALEKA